MTKTSSMLWLIVPSTLLTGLILSLLLHFDLQIPLLNFVNRLQNLGLWAPIIFIFLDMLFVVFLLPSVLLTLSAGFLFGTLMGSIIIMVATTFGAAIAFLISRHLFKQSVKDYLHSHKKMKVINEEFVMVGWKVVLLTRLVPFFPLKLSNYLFGAARFFFFRFYHWYVYWNYSEYGFYCLCGLAC
ncbi:TVP38/TMEM64 family protein [Brumicola nitratireducens]|uniref:TVP38/TMEM64 family membrane protein n=1 Tax=Glaciecola nitratireducens (strain JCM 12485 / KCTC 12276 / FR1064) TaxID=1085623 RepID=G4QI77_GLANF|nr:VTT domain-containing protein [Glaciecola nitratireducens]AEP30691.1 DedA family protein [Glaciecola nitratireducens FR1064]